MGNFVFMKLAIIPNLFVCWDPVIRLWLIEDAFFFTKRIKQEIYSCFELSYLLCRSKIYIDVSFL